MQKLETAKLQILVFALLVISCLARESTKTILKETLKNNI